MGTGKISLSSPTEYC